MTDDLTRAIHALADTMVDQIETAPDANSVAVLSRRVRDDKPWIVGAVVVQEDVAAKNPASPLTLLAARMRQGFGRSLTQNEAHAIAARVARVLMGTENP